jgi:glycosyltransferase involved in cell wall biosynthesis
MKILMVCQVPLGQKSGAASRTVNVVKSLREEGHSVTLLSPSYEKYHGSLDVDVFYIPTSKARYQWTFLWHFLSFFYIIFFYILKKPNIIYLRITHLSILQALAAKIIRIPLVSEAHTVYAKELETLERNRLTLALTHLFVKRIYQWSSKIIVITPSIGKSINEDFGISKDKIVTISNGVDINLYKPKNAIAIKRILGLDEKCKYVTFVGNFVRWQGLEFLLKAVPKIANKFNNVKFLLVGDGAEKQKLELLSKKLNIENRIIFIGWIDDNKVSDYINCASICVAPFMDVRNMDLAPLKIFSYLACAKPIVTTNVGGINDLIKEIGAGVVVNQGNSDELATALLQLLDNEELVVNMGQRGRQAIEKKYGWNQIVKIMTNVFEEAISY